MIKERIEVGVRGGWWKVVIRTEKLLQGEDPSTGFGAGRMEKKQQSQEGGAGERHYLGEKFEGRLNKEGSGMRRGIKEKKKRRT